MKLKLLLPRVIEYIFVFLIACFSAWIVYTQSLSFTPLIDYSYQIETAHRIYLGDMPYRDFWLVLPPGLYWILALFMHLAGGYAHSIPVFLMCGINFFVVIASYAVLRRFHIHPVLQIVLLTLLVSAGHAMVLVPNYDVAASLAIVVSVLWFLTLSQKQNTSPWQWFLAGIFVFIPCLFKQNIGLAYTATMISITGVVIPWKKWMMVAFGAFVATLLFILWLYCNNALYDFYYQLFVYTRQALDPLEPIKRLHLQYSDFFHILLKPHAPQSMAQLYDASWYYFWPVVTIISLTIFFYAWVKEKRYRNDPGLYIALPLLVTAQIPRGNYGMWPLAAIVVAWIAYYSKKLFPRAYIEPLLIAVMGIVSVSLRYGTIHFWQMPTGYRIDGAPYTSSLPRLRGLSSQGLWLPHMENMFAHVKAVIPANESVVFLPGEDPFFAYTGRKNPLPFDQMGPNTFPNDVKKTMEIVEAKKVPWIIIKTDVQCPFGYVDITGYLREIRKTYDEVETRNNYLYFRRK